MTSRERIIAANRREPVDRVPCCATFNPLSATLRRGHTWNFPWDPDTPADEQRRYQVEELGLDQIVHFGVEMCRSVGGVESRVWLEGDVLHKAYSTPAGELHAAVRYNDMWPHGEDIPFFSDFNIGHYVEPWLQTEADLEAFKAVRRLDTSPEAVERARERAAAARTAADEYDLATIASVGMGLTGAQHLFGVRELCMMTIDNPTLVDAYLAYEHEINVATLRALANSGCDMIRRNGFYETADFYGPAMLERFLGDRLRREAQVAREGGMLMTYTVHTGVMPILDYLAGLELDALFGIDMAFAGVEPTEVRDTLAGVSSLWTGPSSTYHLWKGPEATREAVRMVFEVFGKTGLILAPCVSAHSIMPWESTLAMIDEWRKLR